jgi:hypothetical protein
MFPLGGDIHWLNFFAKLAIAWSADRAAAIASS